MNTSKITVNKVGKKEKTFTVELYKMTGFKTFFVRSQARRILYGLEKFKKIILDFRGIKAIGQGFADEIFRVWRNTHPDIDIISKNTIPDIEFMIKRVK